MASEDRSWMYPSSRSGRNDPRFLEGLEYFLACAPQNRNEKIRCPCRDCNNCRWGTADGVARHIHRRGFIDGYEVWYAHGEERPAYNTTEASSSQENPLPQMVVDDAEAGGNTTESIPTEQHEEPNTEASAYLQSLEAANAPIHPESNKRLLQHIAQMLRGKVEHGLSQKGFDYFLQLQLDAMHSEDAANMPRSFYETTKYLQPLRLKSVEIDVCVNDCALFYKEYEGYDRCPRCGESRWEINDNPSGSQTISRKKLWYFPLGPRLKRLFLCPEIAEKMTWHAKCKNITDELIHPACGEAWKYFDRCHPSFAAEDRNPRVAMCTDGFNPFERASQHSIWPVFMTVYNLPPELCMTEPFIFMSMIISGPRGPGKNLDVMLQPLVEELEMLFTEGTETYDAHRKQNFIMRVALMWTISDFPGYGMLSSWSTHGRLSCPYCMEHTSAFWLVNGRKHCFFDCHRKFLRLDHPFRTNKSAFLKNKECHDVAPERRSGYEMYLEVRKLGEVRPGKARGPPLPGFGETHNWVQRSIFWQLPYWHTHLVRHNLDVMHVEKNVFDNVFYTLLDDPTKTKDNLNARKDLQILTKRRALFPLKDKAKKAKATYTVNREQKQRIFQWVHSLRFPDGYASKISRCFNLHTLKVANMKSHDCHVFMQRLLTVAFADFLPPAIWGPLAELALFFRKICAPRILASEMAVLQTTIVETVCKLEKIFPPAFFDSMEHLMIHLPFEARVCGPVQYRWMYPFERRMHTLKKYIKNPKHPEGCIAEAYLHHEVTNFCSLYFEDDMEHRINRMGRNAVSATSYPEEVISVFRATGRPLGKSRRRPLSPDEWRTAHLYVLMNCEEVEPYIRHFDVQMCGNVDAQQIEQVRANQFPLWFQDVVSRCRTGQVSESMRSLARGPVSYAKCYNGYIVNGFRFHVEAHRSKGSCNSGVCVRGTTGGSDADPTNYYGTLQSVLEVDYHGFSVFMFMCNWFDTATTAGIWTKSEYGLVEVNPNRPLQVNEPFILAAQASQVYYILSAGDHLRSRLHGRRGWKTVIRTRARHVTLGFSAPQHTTADDNDQNNEPEREYQDDTVPRITYAPYATDDQEIPLATGEAEHVEEFENISDRRERENIEEGMEEFSSDEYSDGDI